MEREGGARGTALFPMEEGAALGKTKKGAMLEDRGRETLRCQWGQTLYFVGGQERKALPLPTPREDREDLHSVREPGGRGETALPGRGERERCSWRRVICGHGAMKCCRGCKINSMV